MFVCDDHEIFLESFNALRREAKLEGPNGKLRELKYARIKYGRYERAAIHALQAFKAHNCYFRAVIIPQAQFDLSYYGKSFEDDKIKRARAYKKFAEMLIEYNTPELTDGILFADNLTRCKGGALGHGDEFIEVMKQRFQYPAGDGAPPPKLKHIQEVNSDDDEYALLQVCDVLLGSTLNGILKLAKGPRMLRKDRVTAKMKEILDLPSLEKDYWHTLTKLCMKEYKQGISQENYVKGTHYKYRLWFWKPK